MDSAQSLLTCDHHPRQPAAHFQIPDIRGLQRMLSRLRASSGGEGICLAIGGLISECVLMGRFTIAIWAADTRPELPIPGARGTHLSPSQSLCICSWTRKIYSSYLQGNATADCAEGGRAVRKGGFVLQGVLSPLASCWEIQGGPGARRTLQLLSPDNMETLRVGKSKRGCSNKTGEHSWLPTCVSRNRAGSGHGSGKGQ